MKVNQGVTIILSMLWASNAQADVEALNAAAQKLCDKTKMCLKQEMSGSEDIPPGMESMMAAMVDEMCRQFIVVADVHEYHDLVEPATDCLNSMEQRSCDELLNADDDTKACKAYQAIADRYQ